MKVYLYIVKLLEILPQSSVLLEILFHGFGPLDHYDELKTPLPLPTILRGHTFMTFTGTGGVWEGVRRWGLKTYHVFADSIVFKQQMLLIFGWAGWCHKIGHFLWTS